MCVYEFRSVGSIGFGGTLTMKIVLPREKVEEIGTFMQVLLYMFCMKIYYLSLCVLPLATMVLVNSE